MGTYRKLTDKDLSSIKIRAFLYREAKAYHSNPVLAREFGVTKGTIERIAGGKYEHKTKHDADLTPEELEKVLKRRKSNSRPSRPARRNAGADAARPDTDSAHGSVLEGASSHESPAV